MIRWLIGVYRRWKRRRACQRGDHLWKLWGVERPASLDYEIPEHLKMRYIQETSRVRVEKRICQAPGCKVEEWITHKFCDRCRMYPGELTPAGFRRCDECERFLLQSLK